MSRGVKDLRELICVSRLTVRESDDEEYSSSEDSTKASHEPDEADQDVLAQRLDTLSLSSGDDDSRQSSAKSRSDPHERHSPDSGYANEINGGTLVPTPPSSGKSARRKRKKKRKAYQDFLAKHDLPKSTPLPPVSNHGDVSVESSELEMWSRKQTVSSSQRQGNFDDMMTYMDASVVSDWLIQANQVVTEMAQWCNDADNFVNFSHFWLSNFPEIQRMEIFKLEFGILLNHMQLAFACGRESGKVKHKDLIQLLDAILREYPAKLFSSKGSHLFLDYLDTLTSERQDNYKKLLSDVKCSTRIKQYAQCLLGTRSFALVSMWSAIVNFYRSLLGKDNTIGGSLHSHKGTQYEQRMYQSIKSGYVDVIYYMLASGKIHPHYYDSQGRSLVFTAVMHDQHQVLDFLISQVKPQPDVNHAADTGNTPLHAASNSGNVLLVITLLKAAGINVNPRNQQCEDATPLHLAVMHGHSNVVEVLLCAKADIHAKMGDLSALDIARDFGHKDILNLMIENSR